VRQKMFQARETANEGDRRKQFERIRAESRTRILDVLNPEQRPIYERLLAELGGGRGGASAPGRVWIAQASGVPAAVEVRTGLSDGSSTEITAATLKEGDEVILGAIERAAEKKAAGTPGPRMF